MASVLKFKVTGMDCAACARKIENAVNQIPGAKDATVGLNTETLSVNLPDGQLNRLVDAVKALGYGVTAPPELVAMKKRNAGEAADKHTHAVPDDHAQPIEGPWYKSAKGQLVIFTGVMIAAAYLYSYYLPTGSQLLMLVACVGGAVPVVKRAFAAAWRGSIFTIEMLMSIAVVGAVAIGAVDEAAVVVFLFAVGELLESVAAGRARAGIKALASIVPKTAMLETDGGLTEVPIEKLSVGSIIVVRPGDRVAADSTVLSGNSAVNESALTGESMPRPKGPGDTVLAGSINTEAALRCQVAKPAEDTVIARVVRLVEEAADAKTPTERFIDKFAQYYMPAICVVAVLVAIGPPLVMGEPWQTWIYRALALLLIGCPCALVIATPAAVASALANGARRGLLVKGGAVLEAVGKVRHIAFDKTGTLTLGKPIVTDVITFGGMDKNQLMKLAAAAEAASSHPLAVAIVEYAQSRGIRYVASTDSEAIPGKGLRATVGGQRVVITASARLEGIEAEVSAQAESLEQQGKSVSAVRVDDRLVGLIAMRDEPRPDAVQGLQEVKALGIRPVMLTGDNRANAEAVGHALGMEVHAELLPEDKLAKIKQLVADGGVIKVGDGINDAPALAAATVGVAMGSGTDVALEAADAAILNNRIGDVARFVSLSRDTMRIIHQNVAIALGLKAIFLVTTVFGFTGLWIAILADTGATVLVTANALRLLRK